MGYIAARGNKDDDDDSDDDNDEFIKAKPGMNTPGRFYLVPVMTHRGSKGQEIQNILLPSECHNHLGMAGTAGASCPGSSASKGRIHKWLTMMLGYCLLVGLIHGNQ